MLAKKYRFNVLSNRGFSVFFRGKSLLVKARPNDLTFPRFGVFLTKKNISLSSQRVAFKRLVFDFLDEDKALLASQPNQNRDFLIINLAKIEKIKDNKQIIQQELKKAFNV
jgi:RNase P protein component